MNQLSPTATGHGGDPRPMSKITEALTLALGQQQAVAPNCGLGVTLGQSILSHPLTFNLG